MGGPSAERFLVGLKGLPRAVLKQLIVHFEPNGGPLGALPRGPSERPPLFPSLTLREARDLAAYRIKQWFLPAGASKGPLEGLLVRGAPREPAEDTQGPPREGPQGGLQGYRAPAVWPSAVPLPERPPPPHAAEVPEGLLRVQAIGHGSFLLQTRGAPGGPGGPLTILTDPFFSRRAGPWGRLGGKRKQQQQQQ